MTDDSGNESAQTSDTEDQMSDIDVNFVFNAPSLDADYHAIRNLLLQLWSTDAESLEISPITESIIAQGKKGFGTVIRCEADDPDEMLDPNAITTLLSLDPEQSSWAQCIVQYFSNKISQKGSPKKHKGTGTGLDLGNGKNFVLLIHERISNLPSEVAGPLCQIVRDELLEKKNGEFKQAKFVIYLCKKYKPVKYTSSNVDVQTSHDIPEYANEEDSILSEVADFKYNYELKKTDSSRVSDAMASFYDGVGVVESREILVFKVDTFLQAMKQVMDFTGHIESQAGR